MALETTKNVKAQQVIRQVQDRIRYSDKYYDDTHEYRHVILPKELKKYLPKGQLFTEHEWRSLGVQQSLGWEHYMIHKPEPHILCFRRPLQGNPPAQSGAGLDKPIYP
eukprot:TRINITY_DN6142_c0_g1_i1.p1 TRINITY_DN6142_c0_g1~~TRINITY_DN6142_c0_g1_i1.p1  ORF type:complete len:108 (+),score=32.34 TRINITY_DN6142_c0_g1_i1:86-409(+)